MKSGDNCEISLKGPRIVERFFYLLPVSKEKSNEILPILCFDISEVLKNEKPVFQCLINVFFFFQ